MAPAPPVLASLPVRRTAWVRPKASRDEDARALASGEKSIEQLREENAVFARVLADARINLGSSESLGWDRSVTRERGRRRQRDGAADHQKAEIQGRMSMARR